MKLTKKKIISLFLPGRGESIWTNIPVLALLAVNIIPLIGVVFLRWSAFYIVLLYWAENLAVGFYNILKMAFAKVSRPAEHLGKLFMIPFFTIHYGGFTAVHGFFVLAMFGKDGQGPPIGNETWPCFLVFVQMLFNIIRQIMMTIPPSVRLAVLSLFASHGISFVVNYLIKGEYTRTNPGKLMGQPYVRVFVMHITILGGGFLTMALGSPVALLLILVILKTAIDIKFHTLEHKKAKSN
ncbi:MAG: hypothetical protein JW715_10820 [Sedimentisphaerales bacterium]|nr:hypothetical protein [Sedimentisphaerales bacterium]